jgi:tetratricopeptide (TPR) repeat protein
MNLRMAVLVLSLSTALPSLDLRAQSDSAPDGNNANNADPRAVITEARREAEAGHLDSAIADYERALTLIAGSSRAYDPIIRFNLATLHAAKGIDAFQADNLSQAIASFRSSLEWNPYSRDIRYNLCQAMYIQASRLKEQNAAAEEVAFLYSEILTEAAKVREVDPANPNLLQILGYTYRNLGDETRAASVFEDRSAAPLEVNAIRMDVGASQTRLTGAVRNLLRKEGDPIQLRFTMLALNGKPIATSDVDLKAAAPGDSVTFATSMNTTEDVAGWRYEVR